MFKSHSAGECHRIESSAGRLLRYPHVGTASSPRPVRYQSPMQGSAERGQSGSPRSSGVSQPGAAGAAVG